MLMREMMDTPAARRQPLTKGSCFNLSSVYVTNLSTSVRVLTTLENLENSGIFLILENCFFNFNDIWYVDRGR